jgi:hypothetical protein
VSEQIENPFLAAEPADPAAFTGRGAAGVAGNGPATASNPSSGRALVVDEASEQLEPSAPPPMVADVPGLERPRPIASRLARLRPGSGWGRWLAPLAVVAVLMVVVVIAGSAMSGGGSDAKPISARRTIAALSAQNHRLEGQVRTLVQLELPLRDQLQAARAQLKAATHHVQMSRKAGGRP